jgi:flavin-dependent dehydrogenase
MHRLEAATRCEDFGVAKEFSYTTKKPAGNGWVLVGDAFGFIDPIYSSGVYFALKTGEMAADAIVAALDSRELTAATLGDWAEEFKAGSQWVRKLVAAYYDNDFSIGGFMKAHPQHAGNFTDILIGRIFNENAGRMFEDMPAHVRHAGQS